MESRVLITTESLKEFGLKDLTGGWGGSQGSEWVFGSPLITLSTKDFDKYWHLEGESENKKFEYIDEVEKYLNEKYP